MEVRDVRRLRDFAPWLLPWGGRYLCAWLGLGGYPFVYSLCLPLSAPTAFYAVVWPLPGASMPQGRHLTLLLLWAGALSTKRHFGRFVVVFNGSLSGTRDKPAGI